MKTLLVKANVMARKSAKLLNKRNSLWLRFFTKDARPYEYEHEYEYNNVRVYLNSLHIIKRLISVNNSQD